MRLPLILAITCSLSLSACTSGSAPANAAPQASTAEPQPAGGSTAMTCKQDVLAKLVGQTADEAVIKKAVAESGARHARVIKPNMAVTMDFREDRASIQVDEQNKIVSAGCS